MNANKLRSRMMALNLSLYKAGLIDKEGLEFYNLEFNSDIPPASGREGE